MAYRGEEQTFTDFSGGMKSNVSPHSLPINSASLVNNVVLKPGGGFRERYGDTVFNSSAMAAKAVTGLAYYKPISGTEYLMAICDDKIYKSEMDGTMDDITGAVTISSSDNNLWNFTQMNDLAIFVGGAPNAPIKWNATGNAAVLAGTPPQGKFAFQTQNRLFICNTTSNPSRVQWSILANPEDWSGTGSGSSDVWTNDGEELTGHAILSNNLVLLFKNNSIHQMVTNAAPFPIYPLFTEVGTPCDSAVTVYGGKAYFMSSDAKFYATDGNTLIDMPHEDIDDILSNLNMTRLKYVQSSYQQGDGYSWIVWSMSSSSATTNDINIVWDLNNNCWLYNPTGYACNVFALTSQKVLYGGHYDGKIYKKDSSSSKYTDDSVSGGLIGGLWRWGWRDNKSFMYSSRPFKFSISFKTQTTGLCRFSYGFDYAQDTISHDFSMVGTGSLWNQFNWDEGIWGLTGNNIKTIILMGSGNVFQPTICNKTSGIHLDVNGFSLSLKRSAQKELNAS